MELGVFAVIVDELCILGGSSVSVHRVRMVGPNIIVVAFGKKAHAGRDWHCCSGWLVGGCVFFCGAGI